MKWKPEHTRRQLTQNIFLMVNSKNTHNVFMFSHIFYSTSNLFKLGFQYYQCLIYHNTILTTCEKITVEFNLINEYFISGILIPQIVLSLSFHSRLIFFV